MMMAEPVFFSFGARNGVRTGTLMSVTLRMSPLLGTSLSGLANGTCSPGAAADQRRTSLGSEAARIVGRSAAASAKRVRDRFIGLWSEESAELFTQSRRVSWVDLP